MLPDKTGDVVTGQCISVGQYLFDGPSPPRDLAETGPRLFIETPFQMAGGNTAHDLIGGHITRDHRPCPYDSSVSDGDTAQDDHFAGHPHVVADDDRPIRRAGIVIILEFGLTQSGHTVPLACPNRNVVTRSVGWMPPGITCTVSLIEQYRPIRDRRILRCVVDEPDRGAWSVGPLRRTAGPCRTRRRARAPIPWSLGSVAVLVVDRIGSQAIVPWRPPNRFGSTEESANVTCCPAGRTEKSNHGPYDARPGPPPDNRWFTRPRSPNPLNGSPSRTCWYSPS